MVSLRQVRWPSKSFLGLEAKRRPPSSKPTTKIPTGSALPSQTNCFLKTKRPTTQTAQANGDLLGRPRRAIHLRVSDLPTIPSRLPKTARKRRLPNGGPNSFNREVHLPPPTNRPERPLRNLIHQPHRQMRPQANHPTTPHRKQPLANLNHEAANLRKIGVICSPPIESMLLMSKQ